MHPPPDPDAKRAPHLPGTAPQSQNGLKPKQLDPTQASEEIKRRLDRLRSFLLGRVLAIASFFGRCA